jgi:tetratricopeptide (TPR) repeat protein
VVALLVLGGASNAAVARPLGLAVGLIGGLALLCALSSFWSGSTELSVVEADRVLVYLGFFVAAFLIAQTAERRQGFAEGLALAATAVVLLGLGSRLLPELFDVSDPVVSGPRLLYPLGYWNAVGTMAAIAVALLLWLSREARWAALRWVAAGAIPAMLLTLYLTYSRGGLVALVVVSTCLLALSADRLWLLATLAIGALAALPAVLAVQARRDLADNLVNQAAVDQGLAVLAILLAGTAAALLLFAGLRRLEARERRSTGRMLELSRDPKVLKAIAAIAAVVAVGSALAVGGRAWDQFTSSDVRFPEQAEDHFYEFGGAGRHDFFDVAIDNFGEHPVLGSGAGTYQFAWNQDRSIDQSVHDAHSLYLEAFSDLGAVGGILVLAMVAGLLWIGFGAWRAARGGERTRNAALLAAMLAFAVGGGFDWYWEIAGLGAVFFLAAGALVAARCAQLRAAGPLPREGAYGAVVGGLAVAWIAAVALVGPLLVDREIEASQSAAADGNLASAVDHAENARSIEPFAASPYVQLGLLAELQGDYPAAADLLSQAIDREDENWQLYYLRSRVRQEAGDAAGARADLERARELNPRAPAFQG